MSSKVCGVIRYKSHDDLIVALGGGLLTRTLKLRTRLQLEEFEAGLLRLEVKELGESIELPVTVIEVSSTHANADKPWARLRFDSRCNALLQAFVMRCDPSAKATPTKVGPKLKIAIIDDSDAQRELAARPFIELGHQVIEARDGLEGLALCLKHEPDVILSDVQMPRTDGWQLLRMLRARKKFARVPVIFLTTLNAEKDRLHGYQLGIDDYVEKPFSAADLVARVERCIRRSSVSLLPMAAVNALRGNLEHVGLPALLSFLELEQKTGILRLEALDACVMLRSGRPVRARGNGLDSEHDGVEALHALLDLGQGSFEFVPSEVTDADSVSATLGMVLLEHARRSDEAAAKRASA